MAFAHQYSTVIAANDGDLVEIGVGVGSAGEVGVGVAFHGAYARHVGAYAFLVEAVACQQNVGHADSAVGDLMQLSTAGVFKISISMAIELV